MAAKPTKPKVRAPEEVWYDVHKHPEGVPGGMGKSPEHHLRGRGWNGHEINEGSGKKTIQYRNQKHPDFVISYGGGTSTKPDHNFRVLYMGTNTNIPKVTRSYSVAEAMNKVEELHQLHNGLVVQPMTHAAAGHLGYEYAVDGPDGLSCPNCGSSNLYSRGFRVKQEEPDLGCNQCREHLHSPLGHDVVSDEGWERGGDVFGMTHGAAVQPLSSEDIPDVPKVPAAPHRDMNQADAYPEFPNRPQGVSVAWNDRHEKQLHEIPTPPEPKPVPPPPLAPVTKSSTKYGGLTGLALALQRAQQDTWEMD